MLMISIAVLRGAYPPAQDNPAIEIVNLSLLDSMFQLSHSDNSLMEEVLKCLVELVRQPNTSRHLYSAMLQLVKDYGQLFDRPALLKYCVQALVAKICTLATAHQQEHSRYDQVISTNCWTILRQIVSSRRLTLELIVELQLEADLQPTFNFLSEPKRVEYDDDLLMIFVRFAQLGHVSEIGLSLISYFGKLLAKYKGSFHNIYPLAMLMLTGGVPLLVHRQEQLGLIYQASKAMLVRHKEHYYAESEQAKALLLMLSLIGEYSGVLNQAFYIDIIQLLMGRLKHTDDISRCFLQESLASALVLAVAFGYHHIRDQAWMPEVMEMVLEECRKIEKQFSRKIFSISLCMLLKMVEPGNLIEQNFLHLFYLCVTMVTSEKVLKRLKRQDSTEIDDEEVNEDDLSDEEEVYVRSTEAFQGKLNNINEFELCNETLQFLKHNFAAAL